MATPDRTSPPTTRRSRSSLALGIAIGFVVALVLVALIAPLVALTHHSASALEDAYGNAAVRLVARVKGNGLPPNPTNGNRQAIERAAASYTGSCSQCHGALGDGQGVFGVSTFPAATDLTSSSAQAFSDQQLFSVIKNGLGFSPMPAFAKQYTDQETWALVTYVRALQHKQPILPSVPTPTTQQRAAARLQTGGDASHGSAVWSAQACGACHGPTGDLSVNPANDQVEASLRSGRPGMPCYPKNRLSDAELRDLQAYIATFPPTGFLGGPEDKGPPPGSRPAGTPGPPRPARVSQCASS
jgi:mono/diheme cytochrome c family protein